MLNIFFKSFTYFSNRRVSLLQKVILDVVDILFLDGLTYFMFTMWMLSWVDTCRNFYLFNKYKMIKNNNIIQLIKICEMLLGN